ncbi:MAG: ribosomal protein S18-alanine N-acetyltransferase [Clostridia bacterium]|nr:ribosomal protein S18-alanine N-acetyltransferase [Clostridia bacterium]
MKISKAVIEDAPYIAEIELQVFGVRNVEKIESDIKNSNYTYYVLTNDSGTIVSYISVLVAGECADIIMVVTDRLYRGRGYATILMDGVIGALKERNVKDVFLEVRENNDVAKRLYKRFGFQPISIRKKYYDGTIDGIVMKLSI